MVQHLVSSYTRILRLSLRYFEDREARRTFQVSTVLKGTSIPTEILDWKKLQLTSSLSNSAISSCFETPRALFALLKHQHKSKGSRKIQKWSHAEKLLPTEVKNLHLHVQFKSSSCYNRIKPEWKFRSLIIAFHEPHSFVFSKLCEPQPHHPLSTQGINSRSIERP